MKMLKKHKIFDIEYLQNAEFTEEDLKNLIDGKSFTISLIVGMFKMTNQGLSESEITKLIKTDNKWMYKYFWTDAERDAFEKCLYDSFINLYRYKEEKTHALVGFWLTQYGLSNVCMKTENLHVLDE